MQPLRGGWHGPCPVQCAMAARCAKGPGGRHSGPGGPQARVAWVHPFGAVLGPLQRFPGASAGGLGFTAHATRDARKNTNRASAGQPPGPRTLARVLQRARAGGCGLRHERCKAGQRWHVSCNARARLFRVWAEGPPSRTSACTQAGRPRRVSVPAAPGVRARPLRCVPSGSECCSRDAKTARNTHEKGLFGLFLTLFEPSRLHRRGIDTKARHTPQRW